VARGVDLFPAGVARTRPYTVAGAVHHVAADSIHLMMLLLLLLTLRLHRVRVKVDTKINLPV